MMLQQLMSALYQEERKVPEEGGLESGWCYSIDLARPKRSCRESFAEEREGEKKEREKEKRKREREGKKKDREREKRNREREKRRERE